jgi:hypothetical protein
MNDSEIAALQSSGLHRRTPFLIQDVMMSQLSIARHYGGAEVNGDSYRYDAATDTLIRLDVMRWLEKQRKTERKTERKVKRLKAIETQTALEGI